MRPVRGFHRRGKKRVQGRRKQPTKKIKKEPCTGPFLLMQPSCGKRRRDETPFLRVQKKNEEWRIAGSEGKATLLSLPAPRWGRAEKPMGRACVCDLQQGQRGPAVNSNCRCPSPAGGGNRELLREPRRRGKDRRTGRLKKNGVITPRDKALFFKRPGSYKNLMVGEPGSGSLRMPGVREGPRDVVSTKKKGPVKDRTERLGSIPLQRGTG